MVSMLLLPTSIILVPCMGSGVVRIDPLRFVAGCHKRWLNQALSVTVLSIMFKTFQFSALFDCVFDLHPGPTQYIHIPVTQYSLFVLKVLLNTNQLTDRHPCSTKIWNGDILVPAYLGSRGKWPVNECHRCYLCSCCGSGSHANARRRETTRRRKSERRKGRRTRRRRRVDWRSSSRTTTTNATTSNFTSAYIPVGVILRDL